MALKYLVTLPPPTATDEGHRELSVTLGDQPALIVELPADATSYYLLCERDVAIALSLTDVDAAGKKSPPIPTLAFQSRSSIPPPIPGALSVELVEQT